MSEQINDKLLGVCVIFIVSKFMWVLLKTEYPEII